MRVDDIRIELGMGLVPLTNGPDGGLTEKIRKLRRAIALDYGFLLPAVRLKDNMDLEAGEYSLQVLGVEIARETMMMGRLLAFSPGGEPLHIAGIDTIEPSFRIPARWIDPAPRQDAIRQGLTVRRSGDRAHHASVRDGQGAHEPADVLCRDAETAGWTWQDNQKLVQDLVPAVLPMTTVQKVLANLLAERVSIRHLALILEAMHEAAGFTRNVRLITEHVRARLALQICKSLQGDDGLIAVMPLSQEWEREIERGDHRGWRSAQLRAGAVAHAGIHPDSAQQAGRGLGARHVAGCADQHRGTAVRAQPGRADQPDHRRDFARRGACTRQDCGRWSRSENTHGTLSSRGM